MNQEEIQTQIEAIRTELNKGDFDSMGQKEKVQQMLDEISALPPEQQTEIIAQLVSGGAEQQGGAPPAQGGAPPTMPPNGGPVGTV